MSNEIKLNPADIDKAINYLQSIQKQLDVAMSHGMEIENTILSYYKEGNAKKTIKEIDEGAITKKLKGLKEHYKMMNDHMTYVKSEMVGLDETISSQIESNL